MLDTLWSWPQLRSMQLGGNGNAHHFFKQHNCNINDPNQKYNSRVAILYRDKLAQLVSNSLKLHGYVLDLPSSSGVTHIEKQESSETQADFFDEASLFSLTISNAASLGNDSTLSSRVPSAVKSSKEGPNVNLSSDESAAKLNDYKPSVIGRKTTATKKGVFCALLFHITCC